MRAGEKCLLAVAALLLAAWTLPAQEKVRAVTQIRITVTDSHGVPVPDVDVIISEGERHLSTDAGGHVDFTTSPDNLVTFEKPGYGSVALYADMLSSSGSVTLEQEALYSGSADVLELPYGIKYTRRESVGTAVTISGEELERYSSSDWRNALCGIVPGLDVIENYGGSAVSGFNGAQVSSYMRNLGPIWLVDGVYVYNIKEFALDASQIESVTVLRDPVDLAAYGATGANGIISVKTRRGKYNDRYFNVAYEAGVNVVDVFPSYVGGEDYARLNNLARTGSGYSTLYSDEAIGAYAAGNPYSLQYPNVDWRKLLLKNTMGYNKAGISAAGGNDRTKYSAYLGYTGADDIYKVSNPDGGDDYNRVNLSANLDIRLNDYVDVSAGMLAYVSLNRQSSYAGGGQSTSPFESLISDINSMPPVEFPVYADNSPDLNQPLYAVTSSYTRNPYAELVGRGHYTERVVMGGMNAAVNFDLRFLTPGLKARTYAWFNSQNLVRIGTQEDYNAYIISGYDSYGKASLTMSNSHTLKMSNSLTRLFNNYEDRFHISQSVSYDRTFGDHNVSAAGDFMLLDAIRRGYVEDQREVNFGGWAKYSYKGRYLAQLSANQHGTYWISDKSNRWAPSFGAGLGWIVSEEPFMRDRGLFDFLKLRLQGGMLHYDHQTTPWHDVDNYGYSANGSYFGPNSNTPQWFGSTTAQEPMTSISSLASPSLGMERRLEFVGGFDAVMLRSRLDISASWYNILRDGAVTSMSNVLPKVYGYEGASYYLNYDSYRYQGIELSAGWKDSWRDWNWSVRGWASTSWRKILQYDELHYKESYRSRIGKSPSAIWGYHCDGIYATDEEAALSTQTFDSGLKARDLILRDYNRDGVVDDNDISVIGDTNPKLLGGITLSFGWKDFDLTATGNWRAFYDINLLSTGYYAGGWGNNRYSQVMLDNADNPKWPRLTYTKVNNNYLNSTFWLTDGSFFKLQTLEVGYSLPLRRWAHTDWLRKARVYVRANNLFTISGMDRLDPEAVNSGVTTYPLMKTFVAGFKLTL